MKKRSNLFVPGQRIADTLLTVVDSVQPNTWRMVIVRCDCGKQFELPYLTVYAGNRYSCGCKKRIRSNAVDHTGTQFSSPRGNGNIGRTLSVIGRDSAGQWQYICHCCAEIFTLPRGLDAGLVRAMREMATQKCINHKRYYPVMSVEVLVNELTSLGYSLPAVALKTERARMLAKYYKPENIKWHSNGFSINGLRGLPDYPLPKEWLRKKQPVPDLRAEAQEHSSEQSVAEQFDEFGET